jgi:hypothetical protein
MTASLSPKFGCGPVRHFKWSRSQCTCNPGFDVTRRPAATQNVGDTSRSHGELFAILCGVRAGTKFVNSTSMVLGAFTVAVFERQVIPFKRRFMAVYLQFAVNAPPRMSD